MYTKLKRDKVFFLLIFYAFLLCGDLYGQEAQKERQGLASWFSSEEIDCVHKACLMANGERLDHAEAEEKISGTHFIAIWGYPFGTAFKICRADKPRTCIRAVCKDRGPKKSLKRLVDVSLAGFSKLEDPKKGLVKVTIEVIK